MERFLADISERQSVLDGDIFELLYSLSGMCLFLKTTPILTCFFRFSNFQGTICGLQKYEKS